MKEEDFRIKKYYDVSYKQFYYQPQRRYRFLFWYFWKGVVPYGYHFESEAKKRIDLLFEEKPSNEFIPYTKSND